MKFHEIEARLLVKEITDSALLDEDWDTDIYSAPTSLTNKACERIRDAVNDSLKFTRGGGNLTAAECKAILQATANYLNAEAIGTVAEELTKAGFELT